MRIAPLGLAMLLVFSAIMTFTFVAPTVKSSPVSATIASTSPVLWLRFDEGAGQMLNDSSGFGNDGWLGNLSSPDQYDPTWEAGILGGGLGLYAWGDFATVPDDDSLGNFTAFTLEAWVNISQLPDGEAIVGKGRALATPLYYLEAQDFDLDGDIEFSVDYRNQHGGIAEQLDASISVSFNEWHHAAATWDGTVARIYVDGVLAGERTTNIHLIPDNGEPFFIGRHTWGLAGTPVMGSSRINGTVDEVKVYDRALTMADIVESYFEGRGLPPDIQPPIADAGEDRVTDQGDTVLFDGSNCSDDTGIINHSWRFVYDGKVRTLGGPNPSFTFRIPGIYNVALTVTDRTGKEGHDGIVVTVLDTDAPVPVAGVERTIYRGCIVMLDASDSFDNVGIIGYTWRVILDNVTETFSGVNLSYSFDVTGDYTIILEVVDASHNVGRSEFVISVVDAPAEDSDSPVGLCFAMLFLSVSALLIGALLMAGILRHERLYIATVATLMAAFAASDEDPETRGLLKGMIMARPGIHYRWLQIQSGKGDGEVLSHLKALERDHEIISFSDGMYKRYYPANLTEVSGDRADGDSVKKAILDLIRERPGISEVEIGYLINVDVPTLKENLGNLEKGKVIKRLSDSPDVRFALNGRQEKKR